MTKNQTIDLLKSQLPGFYSAEQVINLIEKIEDEQEAPKLSLDVIKTLASEIASNLYDKKQYIVCEDDIEFELNYDKRIEITDIPFDSDYVEDCVYETLVEQLNPDEE
jgi:hypothetical protein